MSTRDNYSLILSHMLYGMYNVISAKSDYVNRMQLLSYKKAMHTRYHILLSQIMFTTFNLLKFNDIYILELLKLF